MKFWVFIAQIELVAVNTTSVVDFATSVTVSNVGSMAAVIVIYSARASTCVVILAVVTVWS